jgi:uncharacterized protein (TIGR04255 family)
MAKQRYFHRAPITEALIDIQVDPSSDLNFSRFRETIAASDFGYYVKNPIAEGHFGFKVVNEPLQTETTSQSAHVGLRLHSLDEKYVAQFRLAGLTLSRLPTYQGWAKLVAETKRIWEIYAKSLAPVRVTRVATRFINNLQLPLQQGDSYQTYLNKVVDVPDEAPQAVESFFQRFQLADVESAARVNLTLALDTTPPSGPSPVILDVDAFMPTDLVPPDEQMWESLERLREMKNRTFFATITEKAAELYE